MYETSFSGQLKPRWTRRREMGWVWRREMKSSWSKASFKDCESIITALSFMAATGPGSLVFTDDTNLCHVHSTILWTVLLCEMKHVHVGSYLEKVQNCSHKGPQSIQTVIDWCRQHNTPHTLTSSVNCWRAASLVCSFMLLWANLWAHYVQPQQNAFWEARHLSTVLKRGYLSYCSLCSINSGSPSQGEMTREKLKMCWHDTGNVLKSVG